MSIQSDNTTSNSYPAVSSLQQQLDKLVERLTTMRNITNTLSSKSRWDEIRIASESIKETVEASKSLDQMLMNDASFIMKELERLLLKEDEIDSAVKLRRQLRAAGSAEDVEGLRKQIEALSGRLLETQSHKLVLETRLGEKDRSIKQLEDSLVNTMADMKHIRAEAQKSFLKHDKRTKEAESRVKSMSSELKRANEMATKYKTLYENERRRKGASNSAGTPSETTISRKTATLSSMRASSPPMIVIREEPDEAQGRSRAHTVGSDVTSTGSKRNSLTVDNSNEKEVEVKQKENSSHRGENKPHGGEDTVDGGKAVTGSEKKNPVRRKALSPRHSSPSQFVSLEEVVSNKTCLKVEDIIRKNHQYLEEAGDKDNEVKMWRALFIEMTDKIKAYYNEMMRCQGEVSTLYEERMDLKARLQKEQKDNAIMRKELERHATSFIEYKKLQYQLSEEIKWSKLTPLAPTKIYSKSRPKSLSKSRAIHVESWSG